MLSKLQLYLPLLLLFLGATVAFVENVGNEGKGGRRLVVSGNTLHNNDVFAAFSNYCADANYKLYLFVDVHLYIVATPVITFNEGGTQTDGCQEKLYFHDGGDSDKVINIETESTDPIARNSEEMLELYQGGAPKTFKLQQVLDAFLASKATLALHGQGYEYDVVKRNCAAFLQQMAEYLSLDSDQRVAEHVSYRLHINKHTIKNLRSSENLNDLLHGSLLTHDAPDELLLDLLVTSNIKNFHTCSVTDNDGQKAGSYQFLMEYVPTWPQSFSFSSTSINATTSIESPAIQYLRRYV